MNRKRSNNAAGSGSAGVLALKGRATNQPSCYVNVGSNGVGMNVNYMAPPPGTVPIGSTVESIAKESSYFQDLAIAEPNVDTTSVLANFLQNRGPSFGPDFSGGNQPGGMVTPSMTRTIDRKVFQRITRSSNNNNTNTNNNKQDTEYDDDDDDFEDDDDQEESSSEDDDEDEPFVGGQQQQQQHPAASYATSLASEAKKEQDKQILLAQAFAYATKVEIQNVREEKLEARRAKRSGNGSGNSNKGKRNNTNKNRSNSRTNNNVPTRKQKQFKQKQQQKQQKQRQQRNGRQPLRNGAGREQSQSRLYGKKSKKKTNPSNNSSSNAMNKPPPSAPVATPVLQNTYINISTNDTSHTTDPTNPTNSTNSTNSTITNISTNTSYTSNKLIQQTSTQLHELRNKENNENTIEADHSVADHFLSFQVPQEDRPPPTQPTQQPTQPTQQPTQQPMQQPMLQQSSSFLKRGGGPLGGRPSVENGRKNRNRNNERPGERPSGHKRPSARDRPPQVSIIPEVPQNNTRQNKQHNNNNKTKQVPTRRVRKGELTSQEIDALSSNLSTGSNAQRLRAELENAQQKMSESESAFKRAQAEFAMLM